MLKIVDRLNKFHTYIWKAGIRCQSLNGELTAIFGTIICIFQQFRVAQPQITISREIKRNRPMHADDMGFTAD